MGYNKYTVSYWSPTLLAIANKPAFKSTLEVHRHLQNAKNVLAHTLGGADYAFHHSIGGKTVKPEGHVAVLHNRPTKVVDRSEYSAANFAART